MTIREAAIASIIAEGHSNWTSPDARAAIPEDAQRIIDASRARLALIETEEKRHAVCAEDWGMTVEEVRAEYNNPIPFMAVAQAFVDAAHADPNWWDRRSALDDTREETPIEHGQRLKRHHRALEAVTMPTKQEDLEWANRRAHVIWAGVCAKYPDPATHLRHAHGFARCAKADYEAEMGSAPPAGICNAVHRAIEVIRSGTTAEELIRA